MKRSEIVKVLHRNIPDAYDIYREKSLFDRLCERLKAENPSFNDIHKAANDQPIELTELLKLLVSKKFRGKCLICEGG